MATPCTECERPIDLPARPLVGELVPCDGCGAELEVIALEPVQLAPAPEIEEDWGE